VDDLHDRTHGSISHDRFQFFHMHGELKRIRCVGCEKIMHWEDEIKAAQECACGDKNWRPHIVWFGEMPFHMEAIYAALEDCDLFVSIGTSGNVYPAAGFVQVARQSGAACVELNLERSQGSPYFTQCFEGPAGKLVPQFFNSL
jgi:NAD-dependent deacetylase